MAIPFSDTTNKNGLIQLCESYTGLGDGAISGSTTMLAKFTNYINVNYQKIVTMILESMDDWDWDDIGTTDGSTATQTTYPIGTFPLVANQRDYDMGAAAKIMKIKRVDITYDGTNWYRVWPWDSSLTGYGLGNDTNTDARFSKTKPYYDLRANSLFIYPMASAADVSAGAQARIEFAREPSLFTTSDTTKTPGIDTVLQPMIAVGASFDYCDLNVPSLADRLAVKFADWEARLKRYYSRKNEDVVYQLKPAWTNMN